MCGIACVYSSDTNEIDYIWKRISERGRDAFGAWSPDYFRREKYHFSIPWKPFRNKMVLLNARAIPEPEFIEHINGAKESDAQPAIGSRWAITFNGCISNDKELVQEHNLVLQSEVDTYTILSLLEKYNNFEEVISFLKGSFALIAYDTQEDKLFCATNFVPLYCKITSNSLIITSLDTWIETTDSIACEPYTIRRFSRVGVGWVEDFKRSFLAPLNQDKVLVCCSSGLDSLTTISLYKLLGYETRALYFDYNPAARNKEIQALRKACKILGIEYDVINMQFYSTLFTSRLFTSLKDNFKWKEDAESVISYVPVRNAIMILLAVGLAEQWKYGKVSFGANLIDAQFPDNQWTFVKSINNLIPFCTNWNCGVKVTAPLVNLTKSEILKIALSIEVPLKYSWSCYRGEKQRCGICGPCSFRIFAFYKLGIKDCVEYQNLPEGFPGWKECVDFKYEKIPTTVEEIPYYPYLLV